MKNFFNLWNNAWLLTVVGFVFLALGWYISSFDPRSAIEIFAVPFACFLRAVFVKSQK